MSGSDWNRACAKIRSLVEIRFEPNRGPVNRFRCIRQMFLPILTDLMGVIEVMLQALKTDAQSRDVSEHVRQLIEWVDEESRLDAVGLEDLALARGSTNEQRIEAELERVKRRRLKIVARDALFRSGLDRIEGRLEFLEESGQALGELDRLSKRLFWRGLSAEWRGLVAGWFVGVFFILWEVYLAVWISLGIQPPLTEELGDLLAITLIVVALQILANPIVGKIRAWLYDGVYDQILSELLVHAADVQKCARRIAAIHCGYRKPSTGPETRVLTR